MHVIYALSLLWGNQYVVEKLFVTQRECERAASGYTRKAICEKSWGRLTKDGKIPE